MELDEAVEELYSLTPAEFTPARNELAKQLKGEDRELSERVKTLRKPATAAWVVNMLVRHDAEEMTAVLDLGESLRQAQADLDGDALRELNRQRRRLIAAVAGKGRGIARDLGQKVSEAVIRQVEETLHAAMIDTDAAAAVRTGVLIDPLDPAGLGNVRAATAVAEHTALGSGRPPAQRAAATPSKPASSSKGRAAGSGLKAVPEPDPEERRREERRRAREEARRAVREAEDDLAEAQDELESRERKVSDLQARTLQVNGEIDELRRRIDELEDRLERLDERADTAREERDEAAETLALAQAAAEEARSRLAELSD